MSSDSISQHQSQANSVGNSHLGVASEVQSYKKILESCAILAFTDAFGKITHVNENFCKISGYTEFELVGQDHRIVNSGFHSKEFFKDLWKTLFAGQIWRGEICNRRKNGSLYWVDTTIIPFENEGPYGSKYIAIRNDITERKRLQQELATEHLRTFVAEKMASLGEMTAGIAHELGNPLAAIQGRAEMLKNRADKESGPLAEQAKKTAETIMSLTVRMTGILRSLTSFARDGTKDPFQLTPMSALLENTLEFGAEKYRKRGISLKLEDYNQGLLIECRETQILQILVNLINNSCDAVQGLEEKWIKVTVSEAKDQVLIQVTDSGSGIPLPAREKIFSQFFTTKSVGKGTGLGLYISRNLALEHQGDLFLDSECPNTRFVLCLPKRQGPKPSSLGGAAVAKAKSTAVETL